jgi:hypothetical protein
MNAAFLGEFRLTYSNPIILNPAAAILSFGHLYEFLRDEFSLRILEFPGVPTTQVLLNRVGNIPTLEVKRKNVSCAFAKWSARSVYQF